MLKLLSIEFTNFKVFGKEPYKVDFNGSDLTLLDGPNGYGKTSVFDAIELALTGTLKRLIITEGRQIPNDVVVAYDPNSQVIIDIELSASTNKQLSIRRQLKAPLPVEAKKISKFHDLWDVFIKDKTIWTPVTQTEIDRYLNNVNFIRDFHLFHYVQQEESAAFLKSNNESARANEISQLFGDTASAEAKYSHLKNIEKRLTSQRKSLNQKAELLRKSHGIDNTIHSTNVGEVNHTFLLPWLQEKSRSPEWDLPEFEVLTQAKLSSYFSELNLISEFVRNRDLYIKSLPFLRAIRSPDLVSEYICFFNSLEQISIIEEKRSIDQMLDRCRNALVRGDVPDNLFQVFTLIGRNDFEQFKSSQNILVNLRKTNSGLKTIYRSVVEQHSALSKSFSSLTDETKCPFCGKQHEDHEALQLAASIRVNDFNQLLSDQDKSILALADGIRTSYIEPLIFQIAEFRSKNPVLPDSVIDLLRNADLNRERLNKFNAWIKSCPFSVEQLMFPMLTQPFDAEKLALNQENFMRLIHENTPVAPLEYQVANEGDVFDRMFKEYFDNRNDNLFSISEDVIEKKKKYLEFCFHSSVQIVLKSIEIHSIKAKKLELIEKELAKISDKILKKIRQYKKKLIRDIEIPFYIYSGKILQSHQSGLGQGVFLKDPTGKDELKNVRLVSNYERDHDVLNTMSSGQISAVVIALTLALNKIYAKSFSPILIDDPVQTMDDINMTSLVELLRNEFPDRQIILSTHEDKVAKYFIYKYLKYGRKVRQLNLMTGDNFDSLDNYVEMTEVK